MLCLLQHSLFSDEVSSVSSSHICILSLQGEVQLQVCYDKKARILYVIVKRARNLPLCNGTPPDPLIKVYLLPGRT